MVEPSVKGKYPPSKLMKSLVVVGFKHKSDGMGRTQHTATGIPDVVWRVAEAKINTRAKDGHSTEEQKGERSEKKFSHLRGKINGKTVRKATERRKVA